MAITIIFPSSDMEILSELKQIPGTDVTVESHFDGLELYRVLVDSSLILAEIAISAKAISSTITSVADAKDALKRIFKKGSERYRKNPNEDFVVYSSGIVIVSSEMGEKEFVEQFSKLEGQDDWL